MTPPGADGPPRGARLPGCEPRGLQGTPLARSWSGADGRHLDVRGLAPPGPMVAILGALEGADVPAALVVHLDRDPIFLYPELAELGWSVHAEAGEPGEVRLRLVREA